MPSEHRVLRFPHRRSVGTLFVADESQPEEWELLSHVRGLIVAPENQPIKWTWLEEARGKVTIPAGVKVKLKISGKGSGSLAPLKALQPDDLHTLDLSRSEIIDVSLSHIQDLSALKVLELTATNVTDAALEHLPKLISLQGLGLSHCQITGSGLKNLTNMTSLRELWLSGADLNDSELKHLEHFTSLVQLGLSGTKITNKGLEYLAPLKHLMRMYLFNTQVTRAGAENFRTIVPGCRVKWKALITDEESTIEDDTNDFGQIEGQLPGGLFDILQLPFDVSNRPENDKPFEQEQQKPQEHLDHTLQSKSPNKPSSANSGQNNLGVRHAKAVPKARAEATASGADINTMDETKFWQIIDLLNWEKQGNDETVIEPAVQVLEKSSKKDICTFADILSEKLHKLDGEQFARHIGNCSFTGGEAYFSKQWFVSARCCAVANGKEFFEKVLLNPSLMPKDLEFDIIVTLPARAYERKTGKKFAYLPKYNHETFANKSGWN